MPPVYVIDRHEKACWDNASTDEKSNDWPIYKELIEDSPVFGLPEGNDGNETSDNPGNPDSEEEEA